MRKCPVCNRTYTDESLNFCLEDGATLVADTTPSNFGSPSGFNTQPPNTAQSWQPTVPQNFVNPAPRKKSSPVLWILGILGVLAVVVGVGFFGLLVLIGLAVDNQNENNSNASNIRSANTNGSSANRASTNGSNSKIQINNTTKTAKLDDDFTNWGKLDSEFGKADVTGGEYQVNSKKDNFYYVVVADSKVTDKFATNNATTRVTARSVSGASPSLGYGLVVHSDPTPLKNDYAFVIRTGTTPAFRVIRHINNNETDLVKWTSASQIRTGTQSNELEVRSDGKQLQFYINGQYAASVTDSSPGKGIVGIYMSDTKPVAFTDLKIIDN